MTNKKGRPRKVQSIEQLSFKTYQSDIQVFKNSLIDSLEEDELTQDQKNIIKQFLEMETWRQNIFIVYILNKKSQFKFKELAEFLKVDRTELRYAINDIKKELKII